MIELSSHFVLIEPALIREDLLLRRITYIPLGSKDVACTGKINFEQNPMEDERGIVWTLSFRAVTKDCSVREYNARRIYIGLVMSDGSIRIIGSASEVPELTVAPYAGANLVTCTFESPSPVDL